jgi:hypothetical protein
MVAPGRVGGRPAAEAHFVRPHRDTRGGIRRLDQVSFHLELLTSVDRYLVDLALITIQMVWSRHVSTPAEFRVSFADHIATSAVPPGQANGVFDHITNRFGFAVVDLLHGATGKTAEGLMIRVAAHEAMHAVQYARGADPDGALTDLNPASDEYKGNPFEVEAHAESVLVLKGYFPDLRGQLELGVQLVPVPAESPYTVRWAAAEREGASVKVLSATGTAAP